MPAHTIYDRPYVSPPGRKANNLVHNYHRSVCFAVQMRGDFSDVPTVLYCGATWQLVIDVFRHVSALMGDNLEGYVIHREHSCQWRNGKAFSRFAVELHGLNDAFISLNEFLLIVHRYMQTICWCTVRELSLKKLLNL